MNAAVRPGFLPCARSIALLICFCLGGRAADWPQYRGANHDGISTDRLNKQWTGSVTNPVWRVPLTNCLGSLTVSGGRVFTQTRRRVSNADSELCVALNATNGVELWATRVGAAAYPNGGVGYDDGPRSTPVVEGGSVFVLSSYLNLFRLNATNGAIIWERDLRDDYNSDIILFQNTASPVLENGLIFLNCNSTNSMTLMALYATNGSVAWRSLSDRTTHSTPTLATIHGVRQLIFATQSGLVSVAPATGSQLWRAGYPFPFSGSIGISPVVSDDMVFVGGAHAYGMGSVVVRASLSNTTWSTTRLWSTNNPASHWMTPVAHQGFLYGNFGIQSFDGVNAQLKCIDMRTGAVKWSTNGFGRGATLLMDEHLVSITERGQLVLIKPLTNSYNELARFTAIPNYHDFTNKCWNAPAVCDGRVFVRSTAFVACFDLSVPPLALDVPQFTVSGTLDLSIRTTTGAAVSSNRLAAMEVRATADPMLALTQWNRLTNSLVLTGGVVRIPNIGANTNAQQFFIISEPR